MDSDSSAVADRVPAPTLLSRYRRIVRPLAWAVFALLLYAGVGFIGLPLFARHYAPQFLGDLLGREVSIDEVAFNPFTLTAEFRGLKIMEGAEDERGEGSATPTLGFERLMVNFEISSLWHGGPVVQEVALKAPYARLVRLAEGRYNWSDVIDRLAARSRDEGSRPLFSIANIHVEDGTIEVEDRVTETTHQISSLKLGIPVVSRLTVMADVFVEPVLSMLFDGRHLGAKGRLDTLPDGFEAKLEQLTLKDFELPPWLAYLPFEPSFRLPSGVLDLDLRVEFSQRAGEMAKMSVRGRAQVNQLAIQDRAGGPVLSVAELEVELADIQPLSGRYYFSKLRMQRPEFDLIREPDGSFNVESLRPAGAPAPGATKTTKTARAQDSTGAESPLDFLLSSASIRAGLIRFNDRAVAGGFSSRLEGISLDLRDLASSGQVPAVIRLDYTTASGERFSHQDRLRLKPFEYDGNLTVEGLQPALYGRYYTDFGGEIRQGSARGVFRYRIASQNNDKDAGEELSVEADIKQLELSEFVLGLSGRKGELLRLGKLTLADAVIQPDTRQVRIGEINAQGVALAATRFANGRFDFMALAGKPTPSKGKVSSPWTLSLDKASVSKSSIRFEDRATGDRPAVITADVTELQLSDLTTAKGAKPAKLDLLQGRIGKDGSLTLKGSFVPEPLRTNLEVNLQNFPLPLVQPYIAPHAQLGIREGRLSAWGRLDLRQHRGSLRGSLAGNLTVSKFNSLDRANQQDFLRWDKFAVRKARVDLEPFALAIGEIAVDGLASRLILDERGRLNLREVQRSPGEEPALDAEDDAENAKNEENAAMAEPPPSMKVDRIVVRKSNIDFTDRFIRPNYNVRLGSLSGELTGLASEQDSMAKLDLQASVGREAPVTIKGEFNPFRQDRRLNIDAEVKDFDLPGLSTYSGRYIGYGIARGKLSANLSYRIEDRKLSAENHVFLDQLTFGDAVDSPEATKLPVRLAVSLLKNSRGEIDIHLPVGGTLDDPQFSVFGLVMRAFAGLIGKAITAPFALFGREELSQLDFDPGSFRIGAAQEEKLRDLAKSLEERSSLKLDITGQANAQRDTEGIRYNKLHHMVMAEKRRKMDANAPMDEIDPESEEYVALLEAVYGQAKIKKPRNFVGFAKSLPVREMEKLLLEAIDVKQEDVDSLAGRRETAIQRWLTDQGGISPERLFRRALTEEEAREHGREGNGVRFSLR